MTRQDLFDLYSSDPELIEKWHVKAGQGIDACTEDTWELIKDHELYLYDFGYFSKFWDGKIARLGGFFIKPEYRNSEGKLRFFNELCENMPNTFITGLYNKNLRGIGFLKSLPGTQIITTTDSYTFFLFRQENMQCL